MKRILPLVLILLLLTGCGFANGSDGSDNDFYENTYSENSSSTNGSTLKMTGSKKLEFAEQFSIDYYEQGYINISVADGTEYVLIPDGKEENNLGLESPVFIRKPCNHIYLAATSAMDLFLQLDSLDSIVACSTQSKDYAMEAVRTAINAGEIIYAGKYNAPDYEMLLLNHCSLAIESTMIGHTPKTKEQLESLGIPVFVERSSYESNPLGRLEWIKLYGVLVGKEDEADEFFEKQMEKISELPTGDATYDVKVAFFSVSSSGYITVRKPGDYICRMIEMAGGEYALNDLLVEEDNALSTINIGMEDFYRESVDADILIYNGSIDGGINSIEDLISKSELFKDFKAVKNGKVWSTGLNMFQESSRIVDVIYEMSVVIEGGDELHYLKHME